MREITITPEAVQTRTARVLKYALYILILLPVVAGFFVYRAWVGQPATVEPGTATSATTVITPETLAERFGVKIWLLGVTAAGGMIDLRYKVIDKEKAAFLVGEGSKPPTLIVEESGVTLALDSSAHKMKHNTRLVNDKVYFHFYPNTQNAVKAGSAVTIVFGSMRLTSIKVQ